MTKETLLKKALLSALLVLAAVISIFLLAEILSSNKIYLGIQSSLDQKTQRVLGLSASAAAVSTGISFLPGDDGSQIAQKIADLTFYFLLILSILYTEKSLMAILGAVVFRYVIPFACALLIAYQFWNKAFLRNAAIKLALFGLSVFIAIPISLIVSDEIYENHNEIIEMTTEEAAQMSEKTFQLSEIDETHNPVSSILARIKETTSGLLNKSAQMLNRYIESIAVMIVTTCVIPLLVLAFILWLIKLIFGAKIDFPHPPRRKDQ